MKNNWLLTIILVIVVGALAFWGGMQYQKSQRGNFVFRNGGPNGQGGQFGRRFGAGRPVAGEIIKSDDNTITVKMQDGSSKLVVLSDKTAINKASQASKSDLKVGERVVSFGTENNDGSQTAQNVSIGGMMFRNFPGNGQGQNIVTPAQ